MTTSEKVAYLKGLAEGMGIQEDGGQGKLFHVIIDILEDLSLDLADTKDALVDLTDGSTKISPSSKTSFMRAPAPAAAETTRTKSTTMRTKTTPSFTPWSARAAASN